MSDIMYIYVILFSAINRLFVTDCLSLENDDVLAFNSKMIN